MKLYLRIQLLVCSGVAFGMTLIDYDLRVPVLWQMNSGQSVQLQYDREKETHYLRWEHRLQAALS